MVYRLGTVTVILFISYSFGQNYSQKCLKRCNVCFTYRSQIAYSTRLYWARPSWTCTSSTGKKTTFGMARLLIKLDRNSSKKILSDNLFVFSYSEFVKRNDI